MIIENFIHIYIYGLSVVKNNMTRYFVVNRIRLFTFHQDIQSIKRSIAILNLPNGI